MPCRKPVSYTHLDVYKRQAKWNSVVVMLGKLGFVAWLATQLGRVVIPGLNMTISEMCIRDRYECFCSCGSQEGKSRECFYPR